MRFLGTKCAKNAFAALGELTALPQTPLLALRGLLLKGGEGMGGEKRRGKERKQEGKGGREGKAYLLRAPIIGPPPPKGMM